MSWTVLPFNCHTHLSMAALLAAMLFSVTPGALALGVTEHYRDYSSTVYNEQGVLVYRLYARVFERELVPEKLSLLSLFSMRSINSERTRYQQGVLVVGGCPLYFDEARLNELTLHLYGVRGSLPEGKVVAAEMSYQIKTNELAGEDLTLTPSDGRSLLRKRHYHRRQPNHPQESCISG